jgi:hypothetical protein
VNWPRGIGEIVTSKHPSTCEHALGYVVTDCGREMVCVLCRDTREICRIPAAYDFAGFRLSRARKHRSAYHYDYALTRHGLPARSVCVDASGVPYLRIVVPKSIADAFVWMNTILMDETTTTTSKDYHVES